EIKERAAGPPRASPILYQADPTLVRPFAPFLSIPAHTTARLTVQLRGSYHSNRTKEPRGEVFHTHGCSSRSSATDHWPSNARRLRSERSRTPQSCATFYNSAASTRHDPSRRRRSQAGTKRFHIARSAAQRDYRHRR